MMRCSRSLVLSVVLSVGCGSVKTGHLPDAPPGDPGVDAAVRGTVHVTVLDPAGTGAPAVGANVVFIDPDGTLVKKAATDSAGKADADVLPGASVTSIALDGLQYQLETVLAVVPGDDVILGIKSPDSSSAGDFTVTYPPAAGATSYNIVHPCGQISFPTPPTGGPPVPAKLTIANSCRMNTMELVVIPFNNAGPITSIAKDGIAFMPGGSTTISGMYQGLRSFTGSYTNIDPIITELSPSRAIPDEFGFSNGETFSAPKSTVVMQLTGPQATGGRMITRADTAAGQSQTVRQTIAGTGGTYGLDVGATLLPWLDTPTYDPASRKLVVTTNTTGTSAATPDMYQMVAVYQRLNNKGVATNFAWTISGPGPGDVVLPVLPAELAELAPTTDDSVTVTSATMFEADSVASYDAIRNDVNSALALYTGERPPGTTVRISRAATKRPR